MALGASVVVSGYSGIGNEVAMIVLFTVKFSGSTFTSHPAVCVLCVLASLAVRRDPATLGSTERCQRHCEAVDCSQGGYQRLKQGG